MLFLHGQGYNFFNIGKLTHVEINSLVKAKNRQVKKQEAMAKKNKMKGSRMKGGKR